MARQYTNVDTSDVETSRAGDGDGPLQWGAAEAPIGSLFTQLGQDASELIRQELALAKAELRQTGAMLARDGARIVVAAALEAAGALCLVAFLVAGLGALLGGRYWLSALIIGVVLMVIGSVLVKRALADVREHGVAPDETAQTLREDAAWAGREARRVKGRLTA